MSDPKVYDHVVCNHNNFFNEFDTSFVNKSVSIDHDIGGSKTQGLELRLMAAILLDYGYRFYHNAKTIGCMLSKS